MDSYHDFGKKPKATAEDQGERAEVQNANKYVNAFHKMVGALLKEEGRAICQAVGVLDQTSSSYGFYNAFCEFVNKERRSGYEPVGMDLFFTHYFKSAAGLYIRKTERKNLAASIILATERSTAHTLSDDISLPTDTLRDRPGALTINIHKKSDTNSTVNRRLFRFLCKAYKTKRMQYFLDAEPIGPSELCGLDDNEPVAPGIFYNGIGRMYDPGNSSGILANDAIIRGSARCADVNGNSVEAAVDGDSVASSRSTRASLSANLPALKSDDLAAKAYKSAEIAEKAKEASCYFTPQRKYSLSKADGELLFFDTLVFGDKCPPNPGNTDIIASLGNKRVRMNSLRIVRLTSSQNGIRHYMIAAGRVLESANTPNRAVQTRQQRREILAALKGAAHDVILAAFRIAYDLPDQANPTVSKTENGHAYYALNARDYCMALLDIKRSGDYGLVAAAAAATLSLDPTKTVPIVVTLDRMAAVYALYRGVACMYVLNYDGKRHAKLFNFDNNSLTATEPIFADDSAIPASVLAWRPAPIQLAEPAAAGGAGALASPARPAARPVTRMSSRLQPVAPPIARPSTAPAPAAAFAARPSESASRRAPPAVTRGPPAPAAPAAPAALPAVAADDEPDAEFARYSAMRFPPFAKFADMLADIARGDPAAAELLSPVNMLTYSFLHHYLRNE
jgi:hypothetical protein